MKKITLSKTLSFTFLLLLAVSFSNCVSVHHPRKTVVVKQKRLPPGQAKKITGERSARNHAPGHN